MAKPIQTEPTLLKQVAWLKERVAELQAKTSGQLEIITQQYIKIAELSKENTELRR